MGDLDNLLIYFGYRSPYDILYDIIDIISPWHPKIKICKVKFLLKQPAKQF